MPRQSTRTRALNQTPTKLLAVASPTLLVLVTFFYLFRYTHDFSLQAQHVPMNAEAILAHCAALQLLPGPPEGFDKREESDRFELGTNATLIRNATMWTGAQDGQEIVFGDLLMDRGVIKAMGYVPGDMIRRTKNLTIVDAKGAWVTPGLGMRLFSCGGARW